MNTDDDSRAFRLAADERDGTCAAGQRDARAQTSVRVLAAHLRVGVRST